MTGTEAVVLNPDQGRVLGVWRGGGTAGGVEQAGAQSLRVGPGDEAALRGGHRYHPAHLERAQLTGTRGRTVDLQLLTRLHNKIHFNT